MLWIRAREILESHLVLQLAEKIFQPNVSHPASLLLFSIHLENEMPFYGQAVVLKDEDDEVIKLNVSKLNAIAHRII